MTCSFDGCVRLAKSKGLCNGHNEQRRKGRELRPLHPVRLQSELVPPCSFAGCQRLVEVKGLCGGHYQQTRLEEDLRPLRARRRKNEAAQKCSFDGCERRAESKRLCAAHYLQQRRNRDFLSPVRVRGPSEVIDCGDGSCAIILLDVVGREKERAYVDLCHIDRVRPYRWCSGRKYVSAELLDGSRVRLHRFLMEPGDGMEIDHRDGDPLNNRDSNLRVVTHAQNSENQGPRRSSSTGVRNVHLRTSGFYTGLFHVSVTKNNKSHYGGHFRTLEEAAKKAKELRSDLFTHHDEDRCTNPESD